MVTMLTRPENTSRVIPVLSLLLRMALLFIHNTTYITVHQGDWSVEPTIHVSSISKTLDGDRVACWGGCFSFNMSVHTALFTTGKNILQTFAQNPMIRTTNLWTLEPRVSRRPTWAGPVLELHRN